MPQNTQLCYFNLTFVWRMCNFIQDDKFSHSLRADNHTQTHSRKRGNDFAATIQTESNVIPKHARNRPTLRFNQRSLSKGLKPCLKQ